MKTGSDGIEAIIHGRRISFAETVAQMEDTRLPKCVRFGDFGGAWAASRARKKSVERFLNDLGAFDTTPTSGRLQPRTRGNGARRRNKGWNVSWRNKSLVRKSGPDYGMEYFAQT